MEGAIYWFMGGSVISCLGFLLSFMWRRPYWATYFALMIVLQVALALIYTAP